MTAIRSQVGYIILAHEEPDMVASLADHLAAQGASVVIHADRRAKGFLGELMEALEDCAIERAGREEPAFDSARIEVISTRAGEWGTFGLVEATLDAARHLLDHAPGLSHIALLSGDSLPLRPHAELCAYCVQNAGVDFIESAPLGGDAWVKGGLSEERFTLWFPFAWRRRRWLFDRLVTLQRRFGIRRRLPPGLAPHLGSQWWVLTARSLRAILADPLLPRYRRFFRRSWIPDESFFQTLLRRRGTAARIAAPLMLSRFDETGRPHVFYDDHAGLLAGSDYFFARKTSPWALSLRRQFLRHRPRALCTGFEGRIDPAPFAAVERRRASEHRGLQTQARMPVRTNDEVVETARSYGVLIGRDEALLDQAATWLRQGAARGDDPAPAIHGRLFGPEGAAFCDGGAAFDGNLPGEPRLRDYRPEQFLARVIWARRGAASLFTLTPEDNAGIGRMVLRDGNARLLLVAEADDLRAILERMTHRPVEPNGWQPPPESIYARVAGMTPDDLRRLMARLPARALIEALGLDDTGAAGTTRSAHSDQAG